MTHLEKFTKLGVWTDIVIGLWEILLEYEWVLTVKALVDTVNDVRVTVSNSLSADLRQRPGL